MTTLMYRASKYDCDACALNPTVVQTLQRAKSRFRAAAQDRSVADFFNTIPPKAALVRIRFSRAIARAYVIQSIFQTLA